MVTPAPLAHWGNQTLRGPHPPGTSLTWEPVRKMQILGLHPGPAESEALGWCLGIRVLRSPWGDSYTCSTVTPTG